MSAHPTFTISQEAELSERLLDEALVEAVSASSDFRHQLARFAGVIAHEVTSPLQVVTERSFFHGTAASAGETDVFVQLQLSNVPVGYILIENKISAPFQPRQGQRYRERATQLQSSAGCPVTTLLLAPERYLTSPTPEAQFFERHLPLETAVSWFTSEQRSHLRAAALFRALIERANDGRPLGAKGLFPEIHFSLGAELRRRATGIEISNRPTDWVFMDHPRVLPAGAKLRYRIRDGVAELRFRGRDFTGIESLKTRLTPPLSVTCHPSEVSFSLPVRVSQSGLTGAATHEDIDSIVTALEALISWYRGGSLAVVPR